MRYWILLTLIHYCLAGLSQKNDTAQISSLQTPNSPGFQLLDVSPANIERPTSPKQFALSVLNASGSGSAIPKNFAMEFSPYWFTKPKHETTDKYLNIGPSHYFSGGLRKLAVSIASVYNDSTSGSLLKNTNYISIGIRTNLVTIRKKSEDNNINKYRDLRHREVVRFGKLYQGDPDSVAAAIKSDNDYQSALKSEKELLQLPAFFQFDIAAAYSVAFSNNDFSANRFNRSAAWVTVTLTPVTSINGGNLAILGVARIMDDNALLDTAKNVFSTTTTLDYGASLNYTLHNLSVSFEHLARKYNGENSLNSQRTVLIFQYKVSDNLYVTGTYGKNFGTVKNLFALLGLNFGFGSSALVTSGNEGTQ